MTEAEWLASVDPRVMLSAVREGTFWSRGPHAGAARRKRALFGVACCRVLWPLIAAHDSCRRAVEAMEEQFDRPVPDEEFDAIWEAVNGLARHPPAGAEPWATLAADFVLDADDPYSAVAYVLRVFHDWGNGADRPAKLATILRDIVGNPFRPVPFAPSWRSSAAVGVAQAIHDSRAFDRLPILADALEDAGCGEDQVLSHCRQAGPHVRGCWVVDGVLGLG